MYFSNLVIISPWKRSEAHHLNKLESPSPKDAFCQVWLKLAQLFRRRRFFNFVNVFLLFGNYRISPWKMAIPFILTNFVRSLVEIGPVVLEKKMKM